MGPTGSDESESVYQLARYAWMLCHCNPGSLRSWRISWDMLVRM